MHPPSPDIALMRIANEKAERGDLIGIDIENDRYTDVLFWLNDRKFIRLSTREWFGYFDSDNLIPVRAVMSHPFMGVNNKIMHRFYFSNSHGNVAMEFKLAFG